MRSIGGAMLGCVVGIVVLVALSGQASISSSNPLSQMALTCANQESSAVATIGRLSTGKAIPALPGVTIGLALGPTDPSLVTLAASDGGSVSLADVGGNASPFSSVGVLKAQSDDPALRSCHYKLADSPAASALAARAVSALTAAGLVSGADANAPSAIYMLGDDPTRPGGLIFTLLITGSDPMAAPLAYAVEFDAAHAVGAVGVASWYVKH